MSDHNDALVDTSRALRALNEQARTEGGRSRCGKLGRGKPGRRLRREPRAGLSMKAFARITPEGRAWLARKRVS